MQCRWFHRTGAGRFSGWTDGEEREGTGARCGDPVRTIAVAIAIE